MGERPGNQEFPRLGHLPHVVEVALLDFGGLRLRQYGTLGVCYQETEAKILGGRREREDGQQEEGKED